MTTAATQRLSDRDTRFRVLVSQYVNLVYASALRQLRNAHLADDATQAVFILLHQRLAHIPANRLSSWLLTATRFTCANIRKTERRRAHREQVAAMNHPLTSSTKESPDAADALLLLLDDALATLPSLDREALALHFLQEQPYPQLAAALGISEAAARKRTTRAIGKLRSYFIRHGISTSAATVSALLPTQVRAMTAELHAALTQTILHTCQAGASAPAAALAKGTHAMMTLHSLKPAALLTAAVLLAAVTGLSWYGLSRPATAAPGTPVPPAALASTPATASAVTIDLSTPDKTLDTYTDALRAGDRNAAYACTTIDPARTPPTTGDAFIALTLAQNRMINAAAREFHSTGEEARQFPTLDAILSGIVTANRLRGITATISPDGNSANIPFQVPAAVLEKLPANIQKQVQSFAGHPIHLVRQADGWKLDHGVEVTIRLTADSGAVVSDPETQIRVVQEYAGVYDKIAGEISGGTYPTWQETAPILKSDIRDLHQKYNLSDIDVQLSPAH